MTSPLPFFRNDYPTLFNRGVALLRAEADAGDAKAKAKLDDIAGARGAVYVMFEGEGDVWLAVENASMKSSADRPAGLPVRFAIAGPGEAAGAVLGELGGAVDLGSDKAAIRAARTASATIEKAIGELPMEAHVVIKDTPDFDDVTIKLGVNVEAPPDKPKFTATITFDDVEAIRAGKMDLAQAFMAQKIRLTGDYSRAMQVGMQLMALRSQAQRR
jgi:hypothetical protein